MNFTHRHTISGLLFTIALLTFQACLFNAPNIDSNAGTISHAGWDSLLRKHVDDNGLVDYQGMIADSARLNEYLALLSNNAPGGTWTREEKMAYWINAYNAFTVDLIIDYYPVNSIKDIRDGGIPFVNTVWDMKFFQIAGEDFDLNNIEHGILRKEFDDPRIHFAVVCASMSCPKLQNFAYTGDRLDAQLEEAGREFINEPFRNEIGDRPARLSKLLDWYWGDFKEKYADRWALVSTYTDRAFQRSEEVGYLDYNWELNEQTPEKTKQLR